MYIVTDCYMYPALRMCLSNILLVLSHESLHLPSVTAGRTDEETLSLLWAIFTSAASVVIFTVVGTFEGLATSCCIEETVDNDEVDGDGSGMSYEKTLN